MKQIETVNFNAKLAEFEILKHDRNIFRTEKWYVSLWRKPYSEKLACVELPKEWQYGKNTKAGKRSDLEFTASKLEFGGRQGHFISQLAKLYLRKIWS